MRSVYKRIGGMVIASATLWLAMRESNQAEARKKNAAEVGLRRGATEVGHTRSAALGMPELTPGGEDSVMVS